MGFFSSYGDYLLLVYLVYFYLIGKKILGQPTTCKTGQRTCSPWELGMTYCCHSRVQHRRAFCPDVLHKSGHRNSSSVSGMGADYSFMRKLCWAQEWLPTKFVQDRQLASVVKDIERCNLCHSSPTVVPGVDCTDSSDCGSYFQLFYFKYKP